MPASAIYTLRHTGGNLLRQSIITHWAWQSLTCAQNGDCGGRQANDNEREEEEPESVAVDQSGRPRRSRHSLCAIPKQTGEYEIQLDEGGTERQDTTEDRGRLSHISIDTANRLHATHDRLQVPRCRGDLPWDRVNPNGMREALQQTSATLLLQRHYAPRASCRRSSLPPIKVPR